MDKRRQLLKAIWVTPVVSSVILPLHAQTSVPPACLPVILHGLFVTVLDFQTGENISCQSIAIITDGEYIENISLPPQSTQSTQCYSSLVGAFGRSGTYNLSISAPGYADFSKSGIVLTSDRCGVVTLKIEVALQPI